MDKIVDFSNCKRAHTTFGGSDRKFGVIYEGETYMLKFSDKHAKKHDVSTSYVNNVISEYISSHIASSAGIFTHETVLGTYHDEIVVGCKDFRKHPGVSNIEFAEYVRAKYDSDDIRRIILLDQIYEALRDPQNDIPEDLQIKTIERYWDVFVIDALVGNFDRHIGNWGFLSENNMIRLAPAYDFGSTLFPQVSDEGAISFMKDPYKMYERCLIFPSPALAITKEKVGKVGYYDMMASNYDKKCTDAVIRMVPKVNMNSVNNIIDNTPFITNTRKSFYKEILSLRKSLILDRAFVRCFYKEFDQESTRRFKEGRQFAEEDLSAFINEREIAKNKFEANEQKIAYSYTGDYLHKAEIERSIPVIDRKSLIKEQRKLMEQFGFNSNSVWKQIQRQELNIHHKYDRDL